MTRFLAELVSIKDLGSLLTGLAASFAVGATVTGWFVARNTRKLENQLKHYQKQIEEFYGPLFNLVHQIFLVNHTQFEITRARDASGAPFLTQEEKTRITAWFLDKHFAKLHGEINQILREKLYLVDGSAMPESFYDYLRHAYQERDQHVIFQDLGISTEFLVGIPWPEQFYKDIKAGFEKAMQNYEKCLGGLRK
jgi:hypothetical protein